MIAFMKEINKAELVEILEDYGVDVTGQGIRSADIDHFLSYIEEYGKLDVTRDEDMARARELRKSYGALFRSEDGRV